MADNTQVLEMLRQLVPVFEITEEVERRTGTTKDGKDWIRTSQVAYVERPAPGGRATVERTRIGLGDNGRPFPPGYYLLDAQSYETNQYGDLEIKRFDRSYKFLAPVEDK